MAEATPAMAMNTEWALLEILVLAGAGMTVGWSCARVRSRWWLAAYALPLAMLLLIGVGLAGLRA